MKTFRSLTALLLGVILGGVSVCTHALQEIDDEALSAMHAQDGADFGFRYNYMDIDQIIFDLDRPTGPLGAGYDAYIMMENAYLTGVSADGATTSLPATANIKFDVGAAAQTGSAAATMFDASWSLARLGVSAIRLGTRSSAPPDSAANLNLSTRSFGGMALDTALSAQMRGVGLFNAGNTDGVGRLQITNGKAYFRQQNSEAIWKDININIGYTGGSAGFDNTGFRLQANRFDWNITYNIAHRNSVTPFQTVGATSMLYYGWSGGLRDFEARISTGGIWSGAVTNRSEGLNISFKNNYDTDFNWIIGDPSDVATPRAYIHFTDWVNLPGALYTFDVPNVTIDVIRAGQGPEAISYLGSNYNVAADAAAFAIAVRDLKFLGHSTKATLYDQSLTGDYLTGKTYDWALVYTFGDMDANIFLYPGGRTPALTAGMRLDATIAVKSPSTWQGNTHFMIADTSPGKNVGVGFINTDFLITIDNGFLELNSSGIRVAVLPDADEVTAGIQNAGDFAWRLKTTFGGGYMTNLGSGSAIEGFGLDLYLHASKLDVTLSPPTGSTYIGFSWDAVLVNDSYIKISEPAAPATAFTIGSLSGPLGVTGGKIDLRAGGESTDSIPRLAFEQNLRIGRTASGVSTDVLIGTLAIGSNNIGRLAIPGGNWYGGLALKEPL